MSRTEQSKRGERPRVLEYDRFGFNGHFDPACGSGEDRSSSTVLRELTQITGTSGQIAVSFAAASEHARLVFPIAPVARPNYGAPGAPRGTDTC